MNDKTHIARNSTSGALSELNLMRAWWILVVSTTCTVLFTISGKLTGTSEDFAAVQMVDYGGSAFSILLFCIVRWGRGGEGMRWAMPFGYTLFFIGVNDAYYFSAWPVAGDNVGYAFGVLTPAALMYLRPAFFTPVLVGNHLMVCALILQQPATYNQTVSAIYGTTIVMVIAVISSVIHYRSKVEELEKTSLIARRNQELAASNSSLLEMSQRMDEMMALAAHDLRSPLLGMAGLCEMELSKPGAKRTAEAQTLETIQQGAERMVGLVNAMMEQYSARHGAIEGLTLEICDVSGILQGAAERAQPLAMRKNIEIRRQGFTGRAPAEGNVDALERIFGNLISNAIKYSPEGSGVELGITQEAQWWVCEVRDEGPGIPEGERANLFNKLQKGSNQPTSGEASSGLGLYIAKKLVESMNGTIEFEPGAERGAIFRVRLRAA